jgi:predicted dehydrogenase
MPSSEADIRVGLIGYGLAGRDFHAPLIEAVDGLRLTAVASSRRDEVLRDHPEGDVRSTDEIVAGGDIDLVVIATPNNTHADLARRALAAGKAVVIDKPFALTVAEAEEIAQLAQARGLFLSVFHNRRWDGDFLALREILAEGLIGEVAIFESNFDRFRPEPQDRWKERGAGAGVWWDLGPHLLDQALELFGKPKALWADLAIQRTGGQAHDYAHVVLHYDRLRVVLRASMLAYQTGPRFTMQGATGAVIAGPVDAGFPINLVFDDADRQIDTLRDLPPSQPRRFYEMVRDALREGGPNPVPVASALVVMRLLELAEESSRLGRTLPVG